VHGKGKISVLVIDLYSKFLRKSPAKVIGCPVDKCCLGARHTADWSVPTISDPSINISSIKTFKALIERNKPLE